MKNLKTEGSGKEVETLRRQRRNARLAYIKDPRNINTEETYYKSVKKTVKQEIKIFKMKMLEQNIQLMQHDLHKNNSFQPI